MAEDFTFRAMKSRLNMSNILSQEGKKGVIDKMQTRNELYESINYHNQRRSANLLPLVRRTNARLVCIRHSDRP